MHIGDTMKQSLSDKHSWSRGLFMLLFLIIFALVELVLWGVVLYQFDHLIFTDRINQRLLEIADDLWIYAVDTIAYLTSNTDARPFPFDEWPEAENLNGENPADEKSVQTETTGPLDDDADHQPV
ncbi:MAG: lipase [Gammaproteobacteria bacterium]|nr:lipase [Gammaproteobacteria bacterium]